MNWTLEVVVVPVSDVDRSKEFYAEKLGFGVDHDTKINEDLRFVQLTPPGSGCSIVIAKGINPMAPGSLKGLQLVVNDIHKAHTQLTERGVDSSPVTVVGGPQPRAAQDGEDLNNIGFVYFDDPDGNSWAVQQITDRA